ncbi:hypothetical protein KJ966_30015 [bacterium]|nr:hypothetical protein [bacterium]
MPDKQNVRIKNHFAINAIKQISRIDAFADDIRQLSSIGDIYNNLSNNFIVPASVHSEFHRILSQIKTRTEHLLEALTMVLPKIDKNSIVVKLPNFDSFKDLKYYLEEFETILEQSLSFNSLKSNIKIRGFDTGSYWIEIGLGSVLALQFFGGLAWAAAVIRKKKIEGDVFKEKAKHLVIKNEALEEIKNGLSKSIATLVDSEKKIYLRRIK